MKALQIHHTLLTNMTKVVIGGLYMISCTFITVVTCLCMYAMYKDKDLWKNSCIKVRILWKTDLTNAGDVRHGD